jgi:amino acid adenylation domain-containing protein
MMAQSGIWYAQSLDPASTFYSISDYLDIRGPIDPALMRAAHQRVVAETEALRLRFTQTEQGPAQYIDPSIGSALDYRDVSSEQRPAAAAVACMRAVMAEPPDLLKGTGLYSAALFRLAPDRFMLFQHVHHILLDGWSLILLHNRIAAVYSALASGQSVERDSFPPLRLLLENEAAYRSSTRMDRDRQYWASYLKDADEPVRLSGRYAAATGDVWHRSADLGDGLVRALLSRANDLGVSWRSMAIAVTAAYVGRMTGATEVTLGLPVLGRLSRAERDVPGMTTNGLPLRLGTAPGTSLADFTKHTESAMRAVLLHSRYRSEDLARDFGLLSTGRVLWGPVVNLMAFDYDLRFAGTPAVLRTLSHPKVDDIAVTFYQTSADGALELIIDANATAYQQAEIDAHLSRLLHFLDEAVRAVPATLLGTIPLAGSAERQRLLRWGTGPAGDVPDIGVHALLADWASRTPDATAVDTGTSTLSYRDLNSRADQLARYLTSRGIGPGDVVAFALPRSADLPLAVFGILKSGAAFMAIDPAYPASRISFMVADAGPALILLHSATGALAPGLEAPHVCLDTLKLPGPPGGPSAVGTHMRRNDVGGVAYLVYTSGSTGVPKGVIVSHRGVVNFMVALADRIGAGPGSRTLQFASPGFDAFVCELGQSVLAGGTLVISAGDRPVPGPELIRVIAEHRVSDVILPPSALEVMAPGDLPAGVTVMITGEAAAPGVIERWSSVCRLINGYGPTEATIGATLSRPLSPSDAQATPIGAPLRNMRVYVLDTFLDLVPVGAVGELCVAGAGVSAGYHRQPALAAQRFCPDPFGPPGSRMYRTGDLVRWTPEGELVFLGRSDDQVQLRGIRVELGEVEAVVTACPGVAKAAATVRDLPGGDRHLVAYVVPEPAAQLDAAAIRAQVAGKVPAHLTPSVVAIVDNLPLTPSGKLDRRALPDPNLVVEPDQRIPRTELEEELAAIFAGILGAPWVGIDDNFFDRGGHSLSATRMLGRIRRLLHAELTVADVFRAPTVAALAEWLTPFSGRGGRDVLTPLRPQGEAPPLFCVHPASGESWVYRRLAARLPDGIPVFGLQARSLWQASDLPSRIEDMAAEYLIEIRAVQPAGPYHLLGCSFGGLVAYAMACELRAQGEQVGLLALLACTTPDAGMAASVPMTPGQALREVLAVYSCAPPDPSGGPLTPRRAVEELRMTGGALAGIDEDAVTATARTLLHASELSSAFVPGRYHGDMVVLHAGVGTAAEQRRSWDAWVDGRIDTHDIACRAGEMMHPARVHEIADIVIRELRKREDDGACQRGA